MPRNVQRLEKLASSFRSDRNTSRRIDSLLSSQVRTTQLARLTSTQQRKILSQVANNDGKQARIDLAELDTKRRSREATRTRARRYMAKAPDERSELRNDIAESEEHAFWEFYDAMAKN